MPDIVEQLRMLAGWRKEDAYLLRQAADELERLQKSHERYEKIKTQRLLGFAVTLHKSRRHNIPFDTLVDEL
jgi:hypothetical protein